MKCWVPGEYDLPTSERRDEKHFWSLNPSENMATVINPVTLQATPQETGPSPLWYLLYSPIFYLLRFIFSEACRVSFSGHNELSPPLNTVDHCPSHRGADKWDKFKARYDKPGASRAENVLEPDNYGSNASVFVLMQEIGQDTGQGEVGTGLPF